MNTMIYNKHDTNTNANTNANTISSESKSKLYLSELYKSYLSITGDITIYQLKQYIINILYTNPVVNSVNPANPVSNPVTPVNWIDIESNMQNIINQLELVIFTHGKENNNNNTNTNKNNKNTGTGTNNTNSIYGLEILENNQYIGVYAGSVTVPVHVAESSPHVPIPVPVGGLGLGLGLQIYYRFNSSNNSTSGSSINNISVPIQ